MKKYLLFESEIELISLTPVFNSSYNIEYILIYFDHNNKLTSRNFYRDLPPLKQIK